MKYSVNPSAWGAIFPVPVQVVDEHIRLAGAVQLKVLLWLFRHIADNYDTDKMAEDLRISRPDAEDALQYWVQAGIICEDGRVAQPVSTAQPIIEKEAPKQKKLPDLPYTKPNMEQIIARCEEEPEIRFLFSESQTRLGRTIGHDGQSTLLMMHDHYGLPIEVILMIVEYCSSTGKTSFSYISKMGQDWGEREIDTLEKADEQISALKTSDKLWTELRLMTGISTPKPTAPQVKFLNTWKNEYGYDIEMIYLAYEEMANNCTRLSFPYMDKVLQNWHSNGLKTPEDVENSKKSRNKASKENAEKKTEASYDIDEFTRQALNKPLVYKKKENGTDGV